MTELAFYLVCAAVAIGAGLAFHFLRGPGAPRPPWPIPAVHGAFGAAGLVVLLLALRRVQPPGGAAVAGFAPTAAALLALALALGLAIGCTAWRRRRPAGFVIVLHASLAVAGFAMLWTLVSLG